MENWVENARLPKWKWTVDRVAVLKAAFASLSNQQWAFVSRRLLGHFSLNAQLGLKVIQIARLIEITRPAVSRHQQLSSRDEAREVQHRLAGRPHGKLPSCCAGPVAEYLVTHPKASQTDVLDFVRRERTVRVSTVALTKFFKKWGFERPARAEV